MLKFNLYLILLSFYTQKSQQMNSFLYNGANGVLNSLHLYEYMVGFCMGI